MKNDILNTEDDFLKLEDHGPQWLTWVNSYTSLI